MFGFWEYIFFQLFYCCFAYKIKSSFAELKSMAIFLNFVFKTALIWFVLGGFFCVFSQSEPICNLHSCYQFAFLLQVCTPVTEELHSFLSQSELSNFFVYIITWEYSSTFQSTFLSSSQNLDGSYFAQFLKLSPSGGAFIQFSFRMQ